MKKIYISIIIIFLICASFFFMSDKSKVLNEWISDSSASVLNMPDSAKKAYKKINKEESGINFIALLGYQKIEGTNYAYLAYEKEGKDIKWEIVTVYFDIFKHATLTNKYDLNYENYVNNIVLAQSDIKESNWEIYTKSNKQKLPKRVKKEISKLKYDDNSKYVPLALLGKKDKEYAFLCLTKRGNDYSYNIVTVESNDNEAKLKSVAAFSLEDIIK